MNEETRQDCMNRILGVCPDCEYDPVHNPLCKSYVGVTVHIISPDSQEELAQPREPGAVPESPLGDYQVPRWDI